MRTAKGGHFQGRKGEQTVQDNQQTQPSCVCGYMTLGKLLCFSGPQFPYIQSKRVRPDDHSSKSLSVLKVYNSLVYCFINLGKSDVIQIKGGLSAKYMA